MNESFGTLFVVATPIGNRDDASIRMLQTLKEVALIAAEDTRHSLPLLQYYGVKTPLIPLHEHNEQAQSKVLIEKLLTGQSIALISDAGTPCISDPGHILVHLAHQHHIKVSPIPGSNAAISLLSVSGFSDPHFLFIGFLPHKETSKRTQLESLKASPFLMIFYESPHRIRSTLQCLCDTFGGHRDLVIGRELTKLFEEVQRIKLDESLAWLEENQNREKGEYVLIVEGAEKKENELPLDRHDVLLTQLLSKLSVTDAVKLAVSITGEKRNFLYERALKLTNP